MRLLGLHRPGEVSKPNRKLSVLLSLSLSVAAGAARADNADRTTEIPERNDSGRGNGTRPACRTKSPRGHSRGAGRELSGFPASCDPHGLHGTLRIHAVAWSHVYPSCQPAGLQAVYSNDFAKRG